MNLPDIFCGKNEAGCSPSILYPISPYSFPTEFMTTNSNFSTSIRWHIPVMRKLDSYRDNLGKYSETGTCHHEFNWEEVRWDGVEYTRGTSCFILATKDVRQVQILIFLLTSLFVTIRTATTYSFLFRAPHQSSSSLNNCLTTMTLPDRT